MKTQSRWLGILACLVVAVLAGCGGGDGSAPPATTGDGGGTTGAGGTTTFNGGTLDALKALNANLTFEHLIIAGPLALPQPSSTTISANKLTITPAGKVEYSSATCQFSAAPNITFNVTNDVLIEGSIALNGRNGTRVTETATCNSCTGQRGGDVVIAGGMIKVTGGISNNGGGGGSLVFVGFPSSPCSSGASGVLRLAAATTMDLSGANIDNLTGRNFEGTPGASSAANISAGSMFTMVNGTLDSTGAMTFSAASTDIFGPITYGTLTETIGGLPDVTAPAVAVLSPLAGAVLQSNQAVEVKVQAPDAGMGLRNVRIKGFGYDKTLPTSDFVNGTLTVLANAPTPATLEVTGTDNKLNTKTVTVTGFAIQLTLEAEPNNTKELAQTLIPGGDITGNIQNGDAAFILPAPLPTNFSANKLLQAKIEDFYKVVCCEEVKNASGIVTDRRISVTVDFTGSAVGTDIDVYLFNSTLTSVRAFSKTDNTVNKTETISATGFLQTDMGQTFYIGVQAWDVPVRTGYRIKRGS